ncbi:hypothetical protein DITRI_Ditri17bG0125500 [Diplodiscus trichospermus]
MPIPRSAVLIVSVIWGGLGLLVGCFVPPKEKVLLEDACNYFEGNWTYDGDWPPYYNDIWAYTPQNPLYPGSRDTSCPFLPKELNCIKNRPPLPVSVSLKFRWKPNSCELPRFNGENIFKLYKGKRFMFVGDSVGHDQYISFACMLHAVYRLDPYLLDQTEGDLTNVTAPTYNVSMLFSRSDFLVDMDVGDQNERILKLDSIGNGSRAWKDADVLIFNSWNKWLHMGQNQSWDVIEEGNTRHEDMDPLVAYGKALNTWAKWVNSTLDTTKTKAKNNCELETRPGGPHPSEDVLAKTLKSLPKSVHFIDVAPLSKLRKATHPLIGDSDDYDYSHWCLAGVPDAWNELVYASLVGY